MVTRLLQACSKPLVWKEFVKAASSAAAPMTWSVPSRNNHALFSRTQFLIYKNEAHSCTKDLLRQVSYFKGRRPRSHSINDQRTCESSWAFRTPPSVWQIYHLDVLSSEVKERPDTHWDAARSEWSGSCHSSLWSILSLKAQIGLCYILTDLKTQNHRKRVN